MTAELLHYNSRPFRQSDRERRAVLTEAMVHRLQCCSVSERTALQDELIVINLGLADAIANRYAGRGVAVEDLRQVAYLALVRASRQFDPQTGHSFFSYAVPTLRGEVRRFFRDRGWMIRPPRRVQELQARVTRAQSELSATTGSTPTMREIAVRLGEPLDDVREAMGNEGAFRPASIDRVVREDGSVPLSELLGSEDPRFGEAEAWLVLAPAIKTLGARDRHVIVMRFFRDCTQREIAEDIGVTQMQVSRILSRIFADLRRSIEAAPEEAG